MKSKYLIICILMVTVLSCSSSKSPITEAQIKALDSIMAKPDFSIKSDWAYPQATLAMQQIANSGLLGSGNVANAINLIGNYNFLTISGDSISSHLPYYGERQMHVDYNGGDSAIEFKGLVENYKALKNKNKSYTITFSAKSKSETFNTTLTIFPNLKANILLSGSSRNSIRYSGTVSKAKE
ncbi:DUF4251 domain-containing protein [Yeosuana marina]|uniref:DUF4251 domain-containing protein n=1 Tax=Yeosuana marina TaxID=1565536 RepID=UPI0030C8B45C